VTQLENGLRGVPQTRRDHTARLFWITHSRLGIENGKDPFGRRELVGEAAGRGGQGLHRLEGRDGHQTDHGEPNAGESPLAHHGNAEDQYQPDRGVGGKRDAGRAQGLAAGGPFPGSLRPA